MVLPRPLVLFLSFCGGAALFVTPLLLAALALGGSGAQAGAVEPSGSAGGATASPAAADPDAIVGELTITAFDMGFEPAMPEVAVAGRYTVTVVNDGAIPHDVTFAEGTTIAAAAGETVTGEVVVPADGIGFICSVPGHEAAGMSGDVMVAGAASAAPSPSGAASPAAGPVAPDPAAPAYTPRDAAAPARAEGTVHDIELVMTERLMTVADGYQQLVWTFGDEVPGPVMRVTVGDTVRVTIKNPATNQMSHSIDFHASMVAWNDEMRSIAPGEELVYEYVAEYAGVFMYHCGTAPALHHIANGMYGMIIVEPEGGLPPVDHEFALVQSEWYLGPQGEVTDLAKASAAAPAPDFVVWNGVANQYLDHPIEVPVGDTVRVFVLNAGPNVDSSFHVVGTIFHSVIKEGVHLSEGNDGNWGAQAVDLAPAQGAIIEMRFAEDGLYPIVTHAFNFVGRGALGLFKAGDGGAPMAGGH